MKKIIFPVFLFVLFLIFFQVYISDPYATSLYPTPFVARLNSKGMIRITQKASVTVNDTIFAKAVRWYIDSWFRIVALSWNGEKPISGSVANIIAQIHTERFNPQKPYVITGGQFSDLYVRNMGIFFNSLFDGCIPSTNQDWINREEIGSQTIALDLTLLQKVQTEPTTFTAIWPNVYVPVNVYARASDSLHGIFYSLAAMQDPRMTEWMYANTSSCHQLQTVAASKQLVSDNKANLIRLLNQYQNDIMDPKTGLIKTTIHISSARDGVKRQSSFYDNVIAWDTMKIARNLGLVSYSDAYFAEWKNRIISAFWDKDGLFINDLSSDSKKNHTFSGDEFIVLQTRFLDVTNPKDKQKLEAMVAYVEKNNFNKPFPLMYASSDPISTEYFFVHLAAPDYEGRSLWSHWGIEYIKTLIILGENEKALSFLQEYTENIKKFGGYPEVYDTKGNPLHTFLYKSVLHSGWVIDYEEAEEMMRNSKN